jgi:hypothetical protein
MSEGILRAAMFLAYGPFVLMVCLYVAGLLLRWMGCPDVLRTLVNRTEIPAPVERTEGEAEP